jgi:hypothetical protein
MIDSFLDEKTPPFENEVFKRWGLSYSLSFYCSVYKYILPSIKLVIDKISLSL